MADNTPPTDDFFEQILGFPNYNASAHPGADAAAPMMLQLGAFGGGGGGGGYPLGLSMEPAKIGGYTNDAPPSGRRTFLRDDAVSSSVKQGFHAQPMTNMAPSGPQPPAMRPRIRARRGQATDPHSIAERLRRERIAERIRALQELVPTVNKTDRAAMLDEVVDYVKFLRLQVKVLSMSRLGGGGGGAVATRGTDVPIVIEDENGGRSEWSNDGTERQVAKLMEENVGAAMQFLQSKGLCVMPISLASAIYNTQSPDVKPEPEPEPELERPSL